MRTISTVAAAVALMFFALPLKGDIEVDARIAKGMKGFSRDYAATANDVYYALRFALRENGWSLAEEGTDVGIFRTSWRPASADSHYLPEFGRRDYGVTNSYHQLELRVADEGGRTRVDVTSRVKTLVAHLKSSGIMENKVLDSIGNYLRKKEPELTNFGINE